MDESFHYDCITFFIVITITNWANSVAAILFEDALFTRPAVQLCRPYIAHQLTYDQGDIRKEEVQARAYERHKAKVNLDRATWMSDRSPG